MPIAFSKRSLGLVAGLLLAPAAAPASAAIDPTGAAQVFAEAKVICARDAGKVWGRSLCGPILIVDPADRSVIANQADTGGALKPSGGMFVGVLPVTEIVANTPIEWSGVRWTELMWPVTDDSARRQATLAHEMFHRIQPSLGLIRDEGGNQHLDTLEGRYLMQLEWRALASALAAGTPPARKAAVADVLLFRRERYRLFPAAAVEEGALEVNEGVPEYTGVRIGLTTPQARIAYAIQDLSAFVTAPTFVRSFAYATGPAYGLLLDEADPAWRRKAATGPRFDQMLASAMRLPASAPGDVKARAAIYDDGPLRASEVKRDAARQGMLAALKAKLVDAPVLILPLKTASRQFNPQTLQPLGEYGTVFPTLRLVDAWGVLEVDDGALLDTPLKSARVSAAGIAPSHLEGKGWRLTLTPGWTIAPGDRKGDLVARPPADAAPQR
jgi:hypothetical protein